MKEELVKALVDKYTELSKDNAFVWIGDVVIYYDKDGVRHDEKIGFFDYECINILFDLKSQEYIDVYQKNMHTIIEKRTK